MKKSMFLLVLILFGTILFAPQDVFAATIAKKCTYQNGEVITIYSDNTAAMKNRNINWNSWKQNTKNQIICPKYIIMTKTVQVGNDLANVKQYSTKNNVTYSELKSDSSESKTKKQSYLGNVEDEDSVAWLIQKILNYIRIVGPVIVLVLTSVDYLRALIQSDDETMAKINKKLGTRLVLIVLLFLIPTLVNVVLSLVGYDTTATEDFK